MPQCHVRSSADNVGQRRPAQAGLIEGIEVISIGIKYEAVGCVFNYLCAEIRRVLVCRQSWVDSPSFLGLLKVPHFPGR
jgi:hypothetical protein